MGVSDASRLDAARVLGWYRPDDTRRILRVLLPAIFPMLVGSTVVGFAYSRLDALDPISLNPSYTEPAPSAPIGGVGPRVPGVLSGPYRRAPAPPVHAAEIPASMWLLFALGFLLVASGPTSILVGLGKSWKNDFFLLLRVDGLVHQTADGQHHVAWEHVARVEHVDGVVRLRMRDESDAYEIRERFSGIDAAGLASRLEDIRRKASFDLLR